MVALHISINQSLAETGREIVTVDFKRFAKSDECVVRLSGLKLSITLRHKRIVTEFEVASSFCIEQTECCNDTDDRE